MKATGMVNDDLITCFRYHQINQMKSSPELSFYKTEIAITPKWLIFEAVIH